MRPRCLWRTTSLQLQLDQFMRYDGLEDDDVEMFDKIPDIEDEQPVMLIEVINENVSTHSSESK